VGAFAPLAALVMSCPRGVQSCDVRLELLLGAPSAAVRTMTPASSGMTRLRIDFNRVRSVSGSLRLIPVMLPLGT
jgi:hypothetical protein